MNNDELPTDVEKSCNRKYEVIVRVFLVEFQKL